MAQMASYSSLEVSMNPIPAIGKALPSLLHQLGRPWVKAKAHPSLMLQSSMVVSMDVISLFECID
jgi:hypothetical protein